jgi:hypothetical protein
VVEADARRARRAGLVQSLKHPMEAETSAEGAKRMKLEAATSVIQPGSGQGRGEEFDVSVLQLETVIELVISGLAAVSEDVVKLAFNVSKKHNFLTAECSTSAARKLGGRDACPGIHCGSAIETSRRSGRGGWYEPVGNGDG